MREKESVCACTLSDERERVCAFVSKQRREREREMYERNNKISTCVFDPQILVGDKFVCERVCMYVCMSVCMREREGGDKEKERDNVACWHYALATNSF